MLYSYNAPPYVRAFVGMHAYAFAPHEKVVDLLVVSNTKYFCLHSWIY